MCQIYLPAGNPSASNTGFSHLPHFSVSMANAVGILEYFSFQSFRNWITPVWRGPPGATDFCGGNFGAGFEGTENRLILEDEGGSGSRACWWRRKNISGNLRCWNGSAASHNSNTDSNSPYLKIDRLYFLKKLFPYLHGIWIKLFWDVFDFRNTQMCISSLFMKPCLL